MKTACVLAAIALCASTLPAVAADPIGIDSWTFAARKR
jgi:hypothetical protein